MSLKKQMEEIFHVDRWWIPISGLALMYVAWAFLYEGMVPYVIAGLDPSVAFVSYADYQNWAKIVLGSFLLGLTVRAWKYPWMLLRAIKEKGGVLRK